MLPASALISTSSLTAEDVFSRVLPWLIGLTVIVVIGGIVLTAIRRSMRSGTTKHEGYTLGDLREMRSRGQLTDEEFEKAKAKVIEAMQEGTSGNSGKDNPDKISPKTD